MYYLAKLAQASGLGVLGIGFILAFPDLMSRRIFGIGALMFTFGWIVEAFLLKGRK